jgi:hypothetical protein
MVESKCQVGGATLQLFLLVINCYWVRWYLENLAGMAELRFYKPDETYSQVCMAM